MAPAGVMDGLLMGRDDLWAPDEMLARPGPPSACQDLVGLPELPECGAGGLRLSRLAAAEADHRIRLAAIRGTTLMAPDATRPTGLRRKAVVGPGFRRSPAQPLLTGPILRESP